MTDAPPLKALRHMPRAGAEDIAAFRGVPVGNIVDAMGRTGALDHRIKAVTSRSAFVGSALPVDAGPRDNLAAWAALRLARPGDVLVITTGGFEAASVCGDILIGMARNAGIQAVVTDGMVRDRSGIDAVGIPVFAAGISPNSPQKAGPGSVGLPVMVGGVRVAAGDIVRGDEDGVVVIPSAQIAVTLESLAEVRAKEAAMEEKVAAGVPVPDWIAAQGDDELFRFVDRE